MTYLVIVDVQENFLAAHLPELQDGVRQAISYAVDKEIPIINLRFAYCGETVTPIADLLDKVGYLEVTKHRESGFKELEVILERGSTVLVCGVNTDCCVAATVDDLAQSGYVVRMIEDACASSSHLVPPQPLSWDDEDIEYNQAFSDLLDDLIMDPDHYHSAECRRQEQEGRLLRLTELSSVL